VRKRHKLVGDILDIKQRLKRGNRLEVARYSADQGGGAETFDLGLLDLESKAKVDTVTGRLRIKSSTCIEACVISPTK
jgi:hypothetical protein